MSVLIRGMEMPENCICCDLSHEDWWCPAKQDYVDRYSFETCPLVPVPPHGRLIDADALAISTAMPLDGKSYQYVHIDNIKSAPTVIPAEPCNNLSKPCKEEEP